MTALNSFIPIDVHQALLPDPSREASKTLRELVTVLSPLVPQASSSPATCPCTDTNDALDPTFWVEITQPRSQGGVPHHAPPTLTSLEQMEDLEESAFDIHGDDSEVPMTDIVSVHTQLECSNSMDCDDDDKLYIPGEEGGLVLTADAECASVKSVQGEVVDTTQASQAVEGHIIHVRRLLARRSLARSRGSTISPSDEEISRHDFTRNTSVRRKILERLQRVPVRSACGVSRDPTRRIARTYPSTASVYSGTHSGDSRTPSAMPSSSTPHRSTPIPSGCREAGFESSRKSSQALYLRRPPTSRPSSGLPERTGVWDGEALRRAVDTHPGERWLAWTRSWALSPPPPPGGDRFTAVPPRRTAQEKRDAEVLLLRSPPQITSSPLQSTLTFSSAQPGQSPAPPVTEGNNNTTPTGDTTSTRRRRHSARRGDGHGTPAIRYAARHTALRVARVEKILAHSYSSRDLAPGSPRAFGAASPDSLEDGAWARGIEQRLAGSSADKR
ncbi:hypothetical protein F5148DRAFT_1368669 [Russula earlei]|uniref:Uncharacterized protein n=1 Tax=Russula earlei TaxID=71964 RepID=A0ACC0U633_9AGAM|nr:hypothetical protein F5148DRAFT_1368669 [Russula earlei]